MCNSEKLFSRKFTMVVSKSTGSGTGAAAGPDTDEDDLTDEEEVPLDAGPAPELLAEVMIAEAESDADENEAELLSPSEALRGFTRSMLAFSRRRNWASRDASCAIPPLIGAVIAGEGSNDTALEALLEQLTSLGRVDVRRGCASVSIVGTRLRAVDMSSAMRGLTQFDVLLMSSSSEDLNLSFVVDESVATSMVQM